MSGNFQTLLGARKAILESRTGALAVIAQLTAWTGFLALPLASLMTSAIVRSFAPSLAWPWQALETIAAATILVVLLGHMLRAITRRQPATIAVTLALLWTGSFAWLAAFGSKPLCFRRTPKIARKTVSWRPSLDTIGGILALATAVALAMQGATFIPIVLVLSAGGLAAAPLVDHWLRRAAVGQPVACAA